MCYGLADGGKGVWCSRCTIVVEIFVVVNHLRLKETAEIEKLENLI